MLQPDLKTQDVTVVDNILNAVLSIMPEPDTLYVPDFIKLKVLSEVVRNFNLDTHVTVTKEKLDVTEQLKALTIIASTVQDIKEDVQFVKSAYTRQPDTKIKKSVMSDAEKSIARKAKLLKLPRVK